jgi:hypothetical protein
MSEREPVTLRWPGEAKRSHTLLIIYDAGMRYLAGPLTLSRATTPRRAGEYVVSPAALRTVHASGSATTPRAPRTSRGLVNTPPVDTPAPAASRAASSRSDPDGLHTTAHRCAPPPARPDESTMAGFTAPLHAPEGHW